MKPNSYDDGDVSSDGDRHYIGTLQAAKRWLTKLAQTAEATLTIPEPLPSLGGGFVMLTASLRRADGAQATFQISCFDDEKGHDGKTGFLPLFPPAAARVTWN